MQLAAAPQSSIFGVKSEGVPKSSLFNASIDRELCIRLYNHPFLVFVTHNRAYQQTSYRPFMLARGDRRNRVPHQSSAAGFELITSIVMIMQRSGRSCLFGIRSIRKDLPQQTRPNRPPLGMKVVKVRINAAADKFQLSHLRSSLAIGIGIT